MEEHNILSSLVDLTRQRDQLALKARLLATLMAISDAAWVVLCRVIREEGEPSVKVLDRLPSDSPGRADLLYPQAMFDDPAPFLSCLSQGHPLWLQDQQPYQALIFQLPNEGLYDDFVVVFREKLEGRLERIVDSVVDLYGNFLQLLIENTQDPLTRLFNRQAFDKDLVEYLTNLQKNRRQADPGGHCYLALFDIDHFKSVNDRYGHLYGDEVLLLFSSLLRKNFREEDRLYRYGGEEFAAILCGLDDDNACASLDRFRKLVEAYDFPQVGRVTVSAGFTELRGHTLPTTVVEHADRALYYSKDNGRNQVSYYERLLAEQRIGDDGGAGDVELF